MVVRSPGYGLRGPAGERGLTGLKGDRGDNGSVGPSGPIGLTGAKGDAGAVGPKGDTGATGPAGASAPTSGRLTPLGNITVSETTLLALGLGTKRMALALTGVVANERLFFAPNGVATAGCEALNVYASAANQVTVSYFTPALGIGAAYSIPITIYRVTT